MFFLELKIITNLVPRLCTKFQVVWKTAYRKSLSLWLRPEFRRLIMPTKQVLPSSVRHRQCEHTFRVKTPTKHSIYTVIAHYTSQKVKHNDYMTRWIDNCMQYVHI